MTSTGKVSTNSAFNHVSTVANGLFENNITAIDPIVQSQSSLYGDAKNSINVAGAPTSVFAPRYAGFAANNMFGHSMSGWDPINGGYTYDVHAGLASNAQVSGYPATGRIEAYAHADTSNVGITNWGQTTSLIPGSLSQAQNKIVQGNTMVDVNGRTKIVSMSSGLTGPVINTAIGVLPGVRNLDRIGASGTAISPIFGWQSSELAASSNTNLWDPNIQIVWGDLSRVPH